MICACLLANLGCEVVPLLDGIGVHTTSNANLGWQGVNAEHKQDAWPASLSLTLKSKHHICLSWHAPASML
jgi:hypothetical protein